MPDTFIVEEAQIIAAANGDRDVQMEIARVYYREEYWNVARYWAEKAEKQGDPKAKSLVQACQNRLRRAVELKQIKPDEVLIPVDLRIRRGFIKAPRPGA